MKWDRTAALTSVIVLGALGVGTAISTHLPKADDVTHAPFIVQGVVGKPVKLRTGELVVLGVDGSTVVTSPSFCSGESAGTRPRPSRKPSAKIRWMRRCIAVR